MKSLKLGQEVRDTVTGFKGIAVTRTEFLQGCKRVEVQPKVNKDGTIPDVACFDEPQLEVIGDGILPKKEEKEAGGPHFGSNPSKPVIRSRRS